MRTLCTGRGGALLLPLTNDCHRPHLKTPSVDLPPVGVDALDDPELCAFTFIRTLAPMCVDLPPVGVGVLDDPRLQRRSFTRTAKKKHDGHITANPCGKA